MAAPMARGANVALTREVPGLSRVVVGVRWRAGSETVLADNLVSAALLCDAGGKALSADDLVFFNQLQTPDLSVAQLEQLLGDDSEQVEVHLPLVPDTVDRIVLFVYVNEGLAAKRTLGQLTSLVVRVVDGGTEKELVRSEELATGLRNETAMTLGELYRHTSGWKWRVLGQAYSGGFPAVAADYGLPL